MTDTALLGHLAAIATASEPIASHRYDPGAVVHIAIHAAATPEHSPAAGLHRLDLTARRTHNLIFGPHAPLRPAERTGRSSADTLALQHLAAYILAQRILHRVRNDRRLHLPGPLDLPAALGDVVTAVYARPERTATPDLTGRLRRAITHHSPDLRRTPGLERQLRVIAAYPGNTFPSTDASLVSHALDPILRVDRGPAHLGRALKAILRLHAPERDDD
ncbi:hypothetical protein ABTX81_30220 [Kitasatospora sp. NPDC097605]|uniref:hypothetical protein n=1 Tax=Kitasatospora sp. NPDC097605 TaxID=3157226 RepID=UPI003331BF34